MIRPDETPQAHAAFAVRPVERHSAGRCYDTVDCIAEEVAVAFVYNGLSHTVMMASPDDLEDFAVGFSIAEGIVERYDEIRDIEVVRQALGIELRLAISNRAFHALKQQRRTLAGRTGCGLCGAESLQQVLRAPRPLQGNRLPTAASIAAALAELERSQHLRSLTGAAHAAALCTAGGRIALLREDVGRHNALDKLIGAIAQTGLNESGSFVVVSSRASYELVHKCCSAGIGTLIAVSAPTTLAMAQAKQLGINLVGFARQGRHVVYHRTDHGDAVDAIA